MPKVVIHKEGRIFEGEVKENSNLVVRAGIRQFPFPNLAYGCGMGKCGKCTSLILKGALHLPAPNWKEQKTLGPKLDDGCRLLCQIWIDHDIELTQDGVGPVKVEAAKAAVPTAVGAGQSGLQA